MFYGPYGYAPQGVNTSGTLPSNQQSIYQLLQAIQMKMEREASVSDLYIRLLNETPNKKHKTDLLHALEQKKAYVKQFTDLYFRLSGTYPVYRVQRMPFQSYEEGLQKAYELEAQGYPDPEAEFLLHQHPYVQNVFLSASSQEQENAKRLSILREETTMELKDYGPDPFVVNIEEATKKKYKLSDCTVDGKVLSGDSYEY
jgi:hypothetical protein